MYRQVRPLAFAIALMVLFSVFAQCATTSSKPAPQTLTNDYPSPDERQTPNITPRDPSTCIDCEEPAPVGRRDRTVGDSEIEVAGPLQTIIQSIDHGIRSASTYYQNLAAPFFTLQELREVIKCLALGVPLAYIGVFLFRGIFPKHTPTVQCDRKTAQDHDNHIDSSQPTVKRGLKRLPGARKPVAIDMVGPETCPDCGIQVFKAYKQGLKDGKKAEARRPRSHVHTRQGCNCHGEMRCMIH